MINERGLSHSVQWALVFPLVVLVLLMTLQWALVAWANSTALAAAQDGARASAVFEGSAAAGREAAWNAASNGSISGLAVDHSRSSGAAEIRVRGSAVSVIPGVSPSVDRTARAPLERLTSG